MISEGITPRVSMVVVLQDHIDLVAIENRHPWLNKPRDWHGSCDDAISKSAGKDSKTMRRQEFAVWRGSGPALRAWRNLGHWGKKVKCCCVVAILHGMGEAGRTPTVVLRGRGEREKFAKLESEAVTPFPASVE